MTTFSDLNRLRCESEDGFNHRIRSRSLSDWMTATLSVLDDAANVIKKLNRIRDNIPNTDGSTRELLLRALADELADADIHLDLLYQRVGLNRAECIQRKFNDTSLKRELGDQYLITALAPMQVSTKGKLP